MRLGLLSEAFLGWRDVIQAKQWKEANMMRWGTGQDALLVAPVGVAADGTGSVTFRWSNVQDRLLNRACLWAAACRALMLWGGNRRQLCFQAWRQWVQLKQGKKKSLRHALHHWQHSYMARALGFWQYYTQRQQVGWTSSPSA